MAWPLLNTLNQAELSNNTSENENQLLQDHTEKLEQLGTLTGDKSSLIFPIKQLHNITLKNIQAPKSMDLDDSENKTSRLDLEAPSEMGPFEIQRIIAQKTKKIQDRPAGVPPDQWPPVQTHLRATAKPYTPTELMDMVQRFRQKPKESVPTWLLRLWDSGAESVMGNGLEISQLATMTVHAALRQRLYAGIQHTNENHSVIDWLMAACHMVWLNKSDIPLNTGLWSSMENLQNYIREIQGKEAPSSVSGLNARAT